jgi:hypothetical protein
MKIRNSGYYVAAKEIIKSITTNQWEMGYVQ